MAYTWVQLRHSLARILGDLTAGTATALAAGSLTDATRRTEAADYWKHAYLKVYSGTNTNQERRVTASTTGGVLTIESNWSTTPSGTVLYELHRYFEAGDNGYDGFLKDALRHLGKRRKLITPSVDTSLTWTTDQYDYTVPTGIVAIERVEFSTETGAPDSDEYDHIDNDRWTVRLSGTRKLVFAARMGQPASGTVIRITGWQEYSEPTADTDSYELDPWPLVYSAAVHAALSLVSRMPSQHWREVARDMKALADEALTQMVVSVPSNVRWVYPQ